MKPPKPALIFDCLQGPYFNPVGDAVETTSELTQWLLGPKLTGDGGDRYPSKRSFLCRDRMLAAIARRTLLGLWIGAMYDMLMDLTSPFSTVEVR